MYLFGVLGSAFFALTVIFGWSIVRALKLPLKDFEQLAAAPIVGVAVGAWLCLLPALAINSLDFGIAVCALIMAATIVIIRPTMPSIEKEHIPAVVAILFIAFMFMFFGLMLYFGGEYHIAFPLYGDAAFHSSMMTSFSRGDNLPPVYPMMAGQPLHYTFLIDFYSAALDRLGLDLEWSVVLPGIFLLAGLLTILYALGTRFTGKRFGGILSVMLIVLSGGLGFLGLVQDWRVSGQSIVDFLAHGNLNYTTNYQLGYVFTNFIVIVLAQRTALIGFAAGILIMLIMYAMLVRREFDEKATRNGLLAAGVLAGLLPLIHTYSYVSVMVWAAAFLILCLCLKLVELVTSMHIDVRHNWKTLTPSYLYDRLYGFLSGQIIPGVKKWSWFMVPAILLALPQVWWISQQVTTSFFKVEVGWMAGSISAMPAFWVKNMGFELILLLAGLLLCGRKNLKFYLPFLAIFVMANLFVFQPWDYDNHKFFSFWLMPSVLLMAASLLYVDSIPKIGKPIFIAFFILTVLTGAMVAVFIVGHPYVEYSKADLYVGDWIMANTPKDAVFLTSDAPTHLVTGVAGRKSYLTYGGWMYTHGIKFDDRTAAIKQMYGAYQPDVARQLLKENRIDYVFVGPSELSSSSFAVNRQFYDQNFQCVFNWTDPAYKNNYRIYKVQ